MNTIQEFAQIVFEQQKEAFVKRGFTALNPDEYCKVSVIPGRKYDKVDVGTSGKFMIDKAGNIYGIKAYGVIHRGHHYGTLNTVEDWYWGEYHPIKRRA
jgi:hypothetical protein